MTEEGPVYSLTEAGLELFPLIQGLGDVGHAVTMDPTTWIPACCSGMSAASFAWRVRRTSRCRASDVPIVPGKRATTGWWSTKTKWICA